MDVKDCRKGMIVESIKHGSSIQYKITSVYKNIGKIDVVVNDRFSIQYPLIETEVFYEVNKPDRT